MDLNFRQGGDMNYITNTQGEKIFNANHPDSFFEVNMCGYTAPNPEYAVYRFRSAIYTIEYVISGVGYIDSDSSTTTVREGDAYLLRSGFTGHYYPDAEKPFSKIWMNIRGSLVDRLFDIYGVISPVTVIRSADRRIFEDLRGICELFASGDVSELSEIFRKSSVNTTNILSIIKDSTAKSRELRSDAQRIYDYLELHICDDVTLGMLAEAMHMHEATVIRVFKEKYGCTPMKYLGILRIEAAKRMLIEDIPIKSIAEMLKFSEPSYFSLCFKRETGITPMQFISQKK